MNLKTISKKSIAVWQRLMLVSLIALAGSFYHIGDFGFYEDDFALVVPYLDSGAGAVLRNMVSAFAHWPQGRPLNHSLPQIFAWLGFLTGHFWGIYLLCATVIVVNTLLIYQLIGKILGPFGAVVGALLFALYPADTTRPFIVHAAHIQTGLTLSLIGLLLYHKDGWPRRVAYLVAATSLTAYESAFLPFLLGVPMLIFLDCGRGRRWAPMLKHFTVCTALISGLAILRLALGESRAIAALSDTGDTIWRSVSSLWIGPVTSIKAVVIALREVSYAPTPWDIAVISLSALAVFGVLRSYASGHSESTRCPTIHRLWIVWFGGVTMWVGSYGLSIINYPPDYLGGRLTSAHTPGAVGAAVACAAKSQAVLNYPGSRGRLLLTGVISVFFACLVVNGLFIQREYVATWEKEKQFWSGLLEQVPDLRHDDVIVITGRIAEKPRAILVHSWADSLVLGQLVEFENSDSSPVVFWTDRGFIPAETAFRREGDDILIRPREWLPDEQKQVPAKTVLLRLAPDGLHRLEEITLPDGSKVHGRVLVPDAAPSKWLSSFGDRMLGHARVPDQAADDRME
ncbi:hypothetical protein ACFL1S_03235 [Pseudomonadota bacterium]